MKTRGLTYDLLRFLRPKVLERLTAGQLADLLGVLIKWRR